MIEHILKIIWNERKSNVWLILEYIIIFCILWFCCDYIYTMIRSYYEPQGYDMNHTYLIEMHEKLEEKAAEIDKYELAMTFMERVKRYPDIESVALSNAAVPYQGSTWISGYKINSDSVVHSIQQRYVSSGFFDVFKLNIQGRIFDWQDDASKDEVIISPFRNNLFGDPSEGETFPVSDIYFLNTQDYRRENFIHKVIATTDKIKDSYYNPPRSGVILPLPKEDVDLAHNQITIRIKPDAEKGFVERFTNDMREQLFIGPYYFASIKSLKDMRKRMENHDGITDKMNSLYAITSFLIINIFLGLLGSFWFRIQARRSEIGLRIALGSSKRKVQGIVIFEALFLLMIASIVATAICLNLGNPDFMTAFGIPSINKERWGIGYEQNIINFVLTFIFLAVVSVFAVWYPARQASKTQPAEALHDE